MKYLNSITSKLCYIRGGIFNLNFHVESKKVYNSATNKPASFYPPPPFLKSQFWAVIGALSYTSNMFDQ